LPAVEADGVKFGEVVYAEETDIVAITGIRLAGIPEADYEFHRFQSTEFNLRVLWLMPMTPGNALSL